MIYPLMQVPARGLRSLGDPARPRGLRPARALVRVRSARGALLPGPRRQTPVARRTRALAGRRALRGCPAAPGRARCSPRQGAGPGPEPRARPRCRGSSRPGRSQGARLLCAPGKEPASGNPRRWGAGRGARVTVFPAGGWKGADSGSISCRRGADTTPVMNFRTKGRFTTRYL
ncbi:translation initiation factor IF-2-like [Cervus elaphus]|uniref:translation initiation factor IF-2-like n=1 Tax=Cervus elaphus TaxID=9860 RepID=UPI001CC28B55|nr:translation initiation factor IF-2-like [Cervus elaphus]